MSLLSFKKTFILMISILVFSNSHANEVDYEDWSGIYYLKQTYKSQKVKHPDFRHFADETNYILISTWKDKLIFQARIKTINPLRYGYFDSEIKFPYKKKQNLIEGKCRVEIQLNEDNLKVDMNSTDSCDKDINISGEYIKYDLYESSMLEQKSLPKEEFYLGAIPKGELFLDKFYNADICDKATQYKTNEEDLMWTKDKVLKEFVDEAKRRELDCGVEIYFEAYVLACLWGKPKSSKYCEELANTRGPYRTEYECNLRVDEIIEEMPVYRPEMEPKGYRCDEV